MSENPKNYDELIALLHDALHPDVFFYSTNEARDNVNVGASRSIVVSADAIKAVELRNGVTFHCCTPDKFFATYEISGLTGGRAIDFSVIDGQHLFEHVLRQFINLERFCHHGSVIAIPNVFPQTLTIEQRDPQDDGWADDVYGIILALRTHRPDLTLMAVDVGSKGMLLVTSLDPQDRILAARFENIVEKHKRLDYTNLHAHHEKMLGKMPYSGALLDFLAANLERSRAEKKMDRVKSFLSEDVRVHFGTRA